MTSWQLNISPRSDGRRQPPDTSRQERRISHDPAHYIRSIQVSSSRSSHRDPVGWEVCCLARSCNSSRSLPASCGSSLRSASTGRPMTCSTSSWRSSIEVAPARSRAARNPSTCQAGSASAGRRSIGVGGSSSNNDASSDMGLSLMWRRGQVVSGHTNHFASRFSSTGPVPAARFHRPATCRWSGPICRLHSQERHSTALSYRAGS